MTNRRSAAIVAAVAAIVLAVSPLFPWYFPWRGADAVTGFERFDSRDVVLSVLGGLAALFSVAGIFVGRSMFVLAFLAALGATAIAAYSFVVFPDFGFVGAAGSRSWGAVVATLAGLITLVCAAWGASLGDRRPSSGA